MKIRWSAELPLELLKTQKFSVSCGSTESKREREREREKEKEREGEREREREETEEKIEGNCSPFRRNLESVKRFESFHGN